MGGGVGGFVGHCVVCVGLVRVSFCVGVGGCLEDSNLESDVLTEDGPVLCDVVGGGSFTR